MAERDTVVNEANAMTPVSSSATIDAHVGPNSARQVDRQDHGGHHAEFDGVKGGAGDSKKAASGLQCRVAAIVRETNQKRPNHQVGVGVGDELVDRDDAAERHPAHQGSDQGKAPGLCSG